MRIYTRKGDFGETSLVGGQRMKKDSARIEACGTVDELNSVLGVVAASLTDSEIKDWLHQIQNELFEVGADLAIVGESGKRGRPSSEAQGCKPVWRTTHDHVVRVERLIDRVESEFAPLRKFILPGGTMPAAMLHFARTVCRRAERRAVALSQKERVNPEVLRYLNRLSDLLFVLARLVNKRAGEKESTWGSY